MSPETDADILRLRISVIVSGDSGEEDSCCPRTPQPIDSEILIAALKQELRGFDRSRVHYVTTLPRNEMGKVLRQEVRAQVIANQGSKITSLTNDDRSRNSLQIRF